MTAPSCPLCGNRTAIPPLIAGWRWYCLTCNTVYNGGQDEWNQARRRRDLWRNVYNPATPPVEPQSELSGMSPVNSSGSTGQGHEAPSATPTSTGITATTGSPSNESNDWTHHD